MKIDLANIAGTLGARARYAISEDVAPTEEFSCAGPVVGELEVENTGSLLLVRGELRALVRLVCVRCLGASEYPVRMRIEEEFATEDTAPDIPTMDREEPQASAMSHFVLDVAELLRQQLLVHIPMAFVCREDCRGICPQCGRNLNEGPCGCPAEPGDSRWGRLADLLKEKGADKGN